MAKAMPQAFAHFIERANLLAESLDLFPKGRLWRVLFLDGENQQRILLEPMSDAIELTAHLKQP